MDIKNRLKNRLGAGKIEANKVLAPYTTFKVGGPAKFYFEAASEEDIIAAVKAAHELKLELLMIGGVSNMVLGDDGFDGLVVRNMYSHREIIEESEGWIKMKISSGYSMTRLAKETAELGFEGFEYHLGLPGTLGGALYMNSKWSAHPPIRYSGDNLVKARIVDLEGNTKEVDYDYFNFAYDYSVLQKTNEIVLWAIYKMNKADSKKLVQRGKDALQYRKDTQPFGIATSGCFFKNVDGESVGKMIDQLGLKGYSIGGAKVSEKHANFIQNTGDATGEDVRKLVAFIKEKVKEKYNVDLEEEVVML